MGIKVLVQIRLLMYLIALFSLFSCYNSLKKDVPSSYNHFIEEVGYDPQSYPSYFTAIDQGGRQLNDLMRPMTQVLSLQRLLGMDFIASSSTSTKVVNVDDFGATANGTDDTEAFKKAWEESCHQSNGGAVLEVPEERSYLLKPIKFSGGGTINGNGKIWWENSCKIKKHVPCKDAPTALTFSKSKNLVVQNLNIKDAQQIHVSFDKCTNVEASGLNVTAPQKSPNTDGIHITHTQNIRVSNSVIGTGDDCISIVSGSQNVQAMDITCGPGHGISIGSLGSKNSKAYVSGVIVDGAKLFGTTNGVRIKTWQGGSGSASNIKFQNIQMYNVTNPIIIDQNYCDRHEPCKEQSSAVEVKDVFYKNIKGTSASDVAIEFDCSKSHPCQGIVLQNVKLQGQGDNTVKAMCNNVKWIEKETVSPQCASQE